MQQTLSKLIFIKDKLKDKEEDISLDVNQLKHIMESYQSKNQKFPIYYHYAPWDLFQQPIMISTNFSNQNNTACTNKNVL